MMEISPVPGIRAVPAVPSKAAALGLPAVFETEFLARVGDETYSPSNGKPAGGDEDAFDEPEEEDEILEDGTVSESGIWVIEGHLSRNIRLVA
jgi:hypothetical protein